MQESKTYTYEEVLSEFNSEIKRFINNSQRVAARKEMSKSEVLQHATKIWKTKYKDALHESVLDNYK